MFVRTLIYFFHSISKLMFSFARLAVCITNITLLTNAGIVRLDTTFNETGYWLQTVVTDGSYAQSVAVQPDGNIFLGGWTNSVSGPADYLTLKLISNGTLDTSFDTDGIAITNLGPFDRGDAILIQPDGKVLLGGERYSGNSNYDFAFVRYNTNGTLDNTFDANGIYAPIINGFSEEHLYDMTFQPDGNIVAVGTTAPTTMPEILPTDLAIMRVTPAGTLDTTFNGTGILVVRFNGVSEAANAVVIQPDGKIVIGGFLNNFVKNDYLMMRFEANGMLDTSFGSSGLVITSINGSDNSIFSLALQNDGKLLAGGTSAMARYNPNGTLDNTFGNNGIVNTSLQVTKLLILNDGKILVTGSSGNNPAVSRYHSNGTIDMSFNGTGTAGSNLQNTCIGNSLAVQIDGKVVVGGGCFTGTRKSFVLRLQETTTKGFMDFDGDSKTDLSIFRPSVGEWWYQRSSDLGVRAGQFGVSTDRIVPGDYTGDGKTDIAFWRPATGEWFVLRSEDSTFFAFPFGATGDVPMPADYDGDGRMDAAVFRPSSATWFILNSGGGGTSIVNFGLSTDKPVAADYDGDGKVDIAIFRPSDGSWWYMRSIDSQFRVFQFGTGSDRPVPGDFTGDGKADIAVWRPSTGFWFVQRSEDNSFFSFPFGTNGDVPVPGDYDGDGRQDAAVFRPSSATWFAQRSTAGTLIQQFGLPTDTPVPSAFVP